MGDILHEFFAVTQTSVYRVSDERGENNWPIVEKIALKEESKLPVGGRLQDGYLVGVMGGRLSGIVLYDQDHPRPGSVQPPEMVNTAFYGGGTSRLVALFLEKEAAIKCHNSENPQPLDPRWRKQTNEVLSAIGDSHPVFIVSSSKGFSFPEN